MTAIETIGDLAGMTGLTWEQFLDLPIETRNCALIDGTVIVNSPNAEHELIVFNLMTALTTWSRAEPGRGEPSTQQPVRIHATRGYQPDVEWYPSEQCAPPGERAAFTGLPGLVIEVLSPSTRRFDLLRKRNDYDAIGIDETWFVDPVDQRVLALRRSAPASSYDVVDDLGQGDTLVTPLLPGLSVAVGDLFAR